MGYAVETVARRGQRYFVTAEAAVTRTPLNEIASGDGSFAGRLWKTF